MDSMYHQILNKSSTGYQVLLTIKKQEVSLLFLKFLQYYCKFAAAIGAVFLPDGAPSSRRMLPVSRCVQIIERKFSVIYFRSSHRDPFPLIRLIHTF